MSYTRNNASGLPTKWPDDLVMTYEFSHARMSDREEFVISKDSCVHDSLLRGHHNRWVSKPDPKRLDDLYTHFLNDDVATIATAEGSISYWVGNERLHVAGGGTDFEIVKSKTRYVVEDDCERYGQMVSQIVDLVEGSFMDIAIPTEIDVRTETEGGFVNACELYIGHVQILLWGAGDSEPFPTLLTSSILPGTHELHGAYLVEEKWHFISWPLKFNEAKHGFQLVLKNDGFSVTEK